MDTIITLLIGWLLSIITEYSKKYQVSQTHIILWFCLFVAIVYTVSQSINEELTTQWLQYWLQILWTCAGIYMFIKKYNKDKHL